jgi:hypothetical protein
MVTFPSIAPVGVGAGPIPTQGAERENESPEVSRPFEDVNTAAVYLLHSTLAPQASANTQASDNKAHDLDVRA